jgi:hypothetical protein
VLKTGKDRLFCTLEPYAPPWYYSPVEYPFPPVGIVGAADGKNRRAFLCLLPRRRPVAQDSCTNAKLRVKYGSESLHPEVLPARPGK